MKDISRKEPTTFTWDDVRKFAEELDVKAHLASMELRNRWESLRPRFAQLRTSIEREGAKAEKTIGASVTEIGKGLRSLVEQIRDELQSQRRSP